MTKREREEEEKRGLKEQLRRRVRKHRPAAKVLELTIALTEEQVEALEEHIARLKMELEYMQGLDPAEIEPEPKS